MTDIDDTDYALLTCLKEADEPLWKKRIHEYISANAERLPGISTISAQTVGRRIERLHDAALVESCILSPDELQRDLIIGYNITEDGIIVMREKRHELLRRYIARKYEDSSDVPEGDQAMIHALLCDHIDADQKEEQVLQDCSPIELITVAELLFLGETVEEQLSSDTVAALFDTGAGDDVIDIVDR